MEDMTITYRVRGKNRSLKGCLAELLKYSFKNQVPVDKESEVITLGGGQNEKKYIADQH